MENIRCVICGEVVEGAQCTDADKGKLIAVAHRQCHARAQHVKTCPKCGEVLQVLLFMDMFPDGFVCDRCHIYYDDDLQPIATIL